MLAGVLIEPTHEFAAIKLDDNSMGVRMEGIRHAIGCAAYTRITLSGGLGMWVDADPSPALPLNDEASTIAGLPVCGNALVFASGDGTTPASLTLDDMATVVGLWRAATLGGNDPAALRPRMALV